MKIGSLSQKEEGEGAYSDLGAWETSFLYTLRHYNSLIVHYLSNFEGEHKKNLQVIDQIYYKRYVF